MSTRQRPKLLSWSGIWPALIILFLVGLTFVLLYGLDLAVTEEQAPFDREQFMEESLACADNFTAQLNSLQVDWAKEPKADGFFDDFCRYWRQQRECRNLVAFSMGVELKAQSPHPICDGNTGDR